MKYVPRLGIAVVLVAIVGATAGAAPTKYALLVGCTKYDHLDPVHHLEGPANDVLLMRDVLKQYYKLQDKDIVILSEAAGKDRGEFRPTRENIKREFAELARKAKKGDKVVILLAGHGSQQPDSKANDPKRFEPDGLEEIFLPADCKPDGVSRVKNAIVDHEFAEWLKAIREKEARLWVIVDACHSSSMTRDPWVRTREIPADKLIPPEVLRQVAEKASERQKENGQGTRRKQPILKFPTEEPDFMALYAAQSTEPTVELMLPEEGLNRKPQGLLTYTLCTILVEAKVKGGSLTYRELLQRIHDQYKAWNRSSPTPLIEGKDSNREILGEKVRGPGTEAALIRLAPDGAGGWIIDAGALHGLTVGSILRVFPPAGQADSEKPVGHVEILEEGFGALQASVKPCQFAGMAEQKNLPKQQGRCELVLVNYGEQRLAIAVDTRTFAGEEVPEERRRPILDTLKKIEGEDGSLVEAALSPVAAKWLLRFESLKSDKLYLMPASGWALPVKSAKASIPGGASSTLPTLFGPVPAGEERMTWLKERLGRIARYRNLLTIAGRRVRSGRDSALDAKFKMELLRFRNELDSDGAPVARGTQGMVLFDKDQIAVRVTNESRQAIDITILSLDDQQYGIAATFPQPGVKTDNRIQPGMSVTIGMTPHIKSAGLEHILVIAVKGKAVEEFAQFGFLSQPSIEKATRSLEGVARGTRKKSLESPLGELLLKAAYGQGRRRTVELSSAKEFAFQLLSYDAVPTRRPAGGK